MDQPKVLKSKGHWNLLNYPFQYRSFKNFEPNLGELNLIGFEEAVERVVKQICKCQLIEDSLFKKKPIESVCQTESHPQIMCWTCNGMGHYSRWGS